MIESDDVLRDYLTGLPRPNIGAEINRQQIEKVLVEEKGYAKSQVRLDVPIRLDIEGLAYASAVDLVVYVKGHPFMVIKCAAGSLASREKEVIAAGRLLTERQVPLAIASDGQAVLVWDTVSGKMIGQSWAAVPSSAQAAKTFEPSRMPPLPAEKRRLQQLIYRSYDSMNINVDRGLEKGSD